MNNDEFRDVYRSPSVGRIVTKYNLFGLEL